MTPQEKVKKYLEESKKILNEQFPLELNALNLIPGSIEIAKMLQREELDGIVISGVPTPLTANEDK